MTPKLKLSIDRLLSMLRADPDTICAPYKRELLFVRGGQVIGALPMQLDSDAVRAILGVGILGARVQAREALGSTGRALWRDQAMDWAAAVLEDRGLINDRNHLHPLAVALGAVLAYEVPD